MSTGWGKRGITPEAYGWDYDGACLKSAWTMATVSVGIFQWVPRARGKGLKRGKVVKRIRGYRDHEQTIYAEAERWIALHGPDWGAK
jgi:hypothetical protein